jgi:spoIIIJ-associated protein
MTAVSTSETKNEEAIDSAWPEEPVVADGQPAAAAAVGSDLDDDDDDDDLDERAEQARAFVDEMLAKMGMDVTVDLDLPDETEIDGDGEIRIEIEGRDSGRIIGKKGQVLAAIQHIVNRVVNRPGLDRKHVVVDAEGYRQRREDTLATMAQRLGKKAVEEGTIITFEPMSPRDRRVVHLALAKFPGVVTKSDGEGEGRRVQIIPVRR